MYLMNTRYIAVNIVINVLVYSYTSTRHTISIHSHYSNMGKLFTLNMENDKVESGSFYDNPPFFPSTLENLAFDVAFNTKVAVMNRISRIRIDVHLKLTSLVRHEVKFILLTALNLVDKNDEKSVHLFIDNTSDLQRIENLWNEMVRDYTERIDGFARRVDEGMDSKAKGFENTQQQFNDWNDEYSKEVNHEEEEVNANIEQEEEREYLTKLKKIKISPCSDIHLQDSDSILLIFNPNNMYHCEHANILGEVQALCFHAALRKIPVVLVNPQLIATG